MNIHFKSATATDAPIIAQLMLFAMDKIVFDFIGEANPTKATQFLSQLIAQENNQYSYQNTTLVLNNKGDIIAAFNLYDGGQLHTLRAPVLALLETAYNQVIHPQDETQAGEYYIDTIAVFPAYRGFGIGGKILNYIIEEFAEKQGYTIGLLVDLDNPKAKKLYINKGFVAVGEKQLMNENHEHLQYIPS